jgi:hypothetical protein
MSLRSATSESFEHNADFLFSGEFKMSGAFASPYEILCFFSAGLSLPETGDIHTKLIQDRARLVIQFISYLLVFSDL